MFRKKQEQQEPEYKMDNGNGISKLPDEELSATEFSLNKKPIVKPPIEDLISKITEPYGDNVNDRVKLVRDVLNAILGED